MISRFAALGALVLAALVVGFVLRLVTIAAVSISGATLTLRGGDENTFLGDARKIAASGFDSDLWFPAQFHRLHEIVFALQMKLGGFEDGALRVTQVGMALLGIVLILAAIYDLAGPRAARVAAWVLALEPASILYNGILHREPMLVLASGLVILGGAKIWTRLELRCKPWAVPLTSRWAAYSTERRGSWPSATR